jgi:hypothetical protein
MAAVDLRSLALRRGSADQYAPDEAERVHPVVLAGPAGELDSSRGSMCSTLI